MSEKFIGDGIVHLGVKYTLSEDVVKELEFILKNGPIFENTIRPESAKPILFDLKLVTKIIVEGHIEKVAATPLAMVIFDKISNFGIETDLNLNMTSDNYMGTSITNLDINLEFDAEIREHGLDKNDR